MSKGSVIYAHCEACDDETPNRILKGVTGQNLEGGFTGTVQCQDCKAVHHVEIPPEKPCMVPMVLSEGEISRKVAIEFGRNEEVLVNDEIFFEEHNILITSIESGARRVRRCGACDISRLWALTFDDVKVKISIVKGSVTASEVIDALPEAEYAVGDILEVGRKKVVVTKIKTAKSMVYREGKPVKARGIRRMYARIVRGKQ